MKELIASVELNTIICFQLSSILASHNNSFL